MSIIRADSIKNRSGLGAPDFPNGITVTGIVTSTILDSSVSTLNVTGGHVNVGSNIQLGDAGILTATQFKGDGSQLTGVVQSDTPLGNSTSSTVFYEADNETTISTDTTLSRTSSNPGVIYTKFQQVVVANTKSLIVDAGETLVVDAYKLRQPDF